MTGAEPIDQAPAAEIHEAVGQEECGVERRLELVGDRDVDADGADRPRERLSIEVADRDGGADEDGDGPAHSEAPTAAAGERTAVG